MKGTWIGAVALSFSLVACSSDFSGPKGAVDAGGGAVDATILLGQPDAASQPGSPDASSASCGTCPAGTTCGTANGQPVCRTATGIPRLSHVFVLVMENTSLSTLQDSTNTPYIHDLMSMGAVLTDYHGVDHPSLPNYLAMVSGLTGDVGCDCQPTGGDCSALNCNLILSSCGCPQSVDHLGDQLEAAGKTWRAYGEDMGTACNLTGAGSYAPRHIPFVYFDSMQNDMPRCESHVVDYGELAGDMAGTTPDFVFIAPNLTNDMHDPITGGTQNLANGEAWLSTEVPKILASSAYQQGGMLIIVWDEDDLSGVLAPDDPIPFIALSPLARSAYSGTEHADHYRLLATIEDALGVGRLGAAAQAQPLSELFPAE